MIFDKMKKSILFLFQQMVNHVMIFQEGYKWDKYFDPFLHEESKSLLCQDSQVNI